MSEPLGIKNPILPSSSLGNRPQSLSKFSSSFIQKTINNNSPKILDFNSTINAEIPAKINNLNATKSEHPASLASPQPLSKISSLSPFQELLSRLNTIQPETNFFSSQSLNLLQKSEQESRDFIFTPNGFKLENFSKKTKTSAHLFDKSTAYNHPESLPNNSSQNSMPVTNPQIIIQDLTEKAYQKLVHRLTTERKRQNSSSRLPW